MVLFLAVLAIAYALAVRATARRRTQPVSTRRACAYLGGLLTLGLAVGGPLDALTASSFAAHMAQHLLLSLVGPPLLALGRPTRVFRLALVPRLPRSFARALGRSRGWRRLGTLAAHPLSLVLVPSVSLLGWHHPLPYQAALADETLHLLEHGTFFGTALLFWTALLDPTSLGRRALSSGTVLLVLFATWMLGDLLGAALTLSSAPLYPAYEAVTNPWGLSSLDDQRLGGLAMWIGGGLFYAVTMLGVLAWPYLGRSERAMVVGRPVRPDAPGELWRQTERFAGQGSGSGLN